MVWGHLLFLHMLAVQGELGRSSIQGRNQVFSVPVSWAAVVQSRDMEVASKMHMWLQSGKGHVRKRAACVR